MFHDSSRSHTARAGFSLVELIVVMVIISMLAGVVTLATRSYLISSKQRGAEASIANIVKAIDSYRGLEGRLPTNDEGLEILVEPTENMVDGYIKSVPKDPWSRPFEYNSPGRDSAYEIICLGEDGREGGEGAARDISSSELGL